MSNPRDGVMTAAEALHDPSSVPASDSVPASASLAAAASGSAAAAPASTSTAASHPAAVRGDAAADDAARLTPLRVALLGNPNCGKTALFNLLTGSRQKVANYAGVTVERKEGDLTTPAGRTIRVIDLPGAYSLQAASADEVVTQDIVLGRVPDVERPDLFVCVTDATNLRRHLGLVLEARELKLPMLVALNLSDAARDAGIEIDVSGLSRELGVPVVPTIAIRSDGAAALLDEIDLFDRIGPTAAPAGSAGAAATIAMPTTPARVARRHDEVRRIVERVVREPVVNRTLDDRIDRIVLHPVWGWVVLLALLFVMFQAVFTLAQWPMDLIEAGVGAVGDLVRDVLPDGPVRSLIVDGIIAGVGSVLVFLPQILILFAFILALDSSGYLPRAAFLLDRPMSAVGLTGRSFIPLLSSFACAIPGIMATRTIPTWRDRIVTILVAPLMTCSARLPVYALLIGAFIPARQVAGFLSLQGIVLFVLYVAGVVSAALVAWAMRIGVRGSGAPGGSLMLELPAYRRPNLRDLMLGLLERARIFLRRVGGVILTLTVILWFLASYPGAPADATEPAIRYTFAGRIGLWLEPLFAPIGFPWQVVVALIPGLAAREVAVGALGTVYALSGASPSADAEDLAVQLAPILADQWSLATACSLLAWYVFAPQCISTLSITRRETNGWKYPAIMLVYLFALAYLASFVTYRLVAWLS